MSDINEQAAIDVMGCHKASDTEGIDCWYYNSTGKWLTAVFHFKPAENISQCFEYIIPAMASKGFKFSLTNNGDYVEACFIPCDELWQSLVCDANWTIIKDPTKAAECIVQAAIKAVAMEGRDE